MRLGVGARSAPHCPEDLGLLGETAASAEARGGRGARWDQGPSSLQKPASLHPAMTWEQTLKGEYLTDKEGGSILGTGTEV